ncbi:MAG: TIGR04283 family arsenosugar biosynthesis glycosyltransferase [Acidobacteria bacterium]|nr:TIGR04283 family arsenosugar biosynthesis glycosyltransferase [Acidobacteriota bacterium]
MRPVTISVVIPVWRDTARLVALLESLPTRPDVQIIVAATAAECAEVTDAAAVRPDVLCASGRVGRGAQMNAGARVATGDLLLFLHVDSTLPARAFEEIARVCDDPAVVGGFFRFALDAQGWRARLMEWGTAQRSRWFDLPYGDQGIFVRRRTFETLGGYRELPLMEDVEFVRRLRRAGRLHRSPLRLVTSARRWRRDGWFRRMGGNWLLMTLYSAGVDPRYLARRYEGRRRAVVAVLARAPSSPGKTRLFESLKIAPDPALLKALLADTMAAVDRVPGVDRALVYAPADARCEMESITSGAWTCIEQRGGDLGERMAGAFEDLHSLGYEKIALIGSDLPSLPPGVISRALQATTGRRPGVVLGPASDGGYYLVALQQPAPRLFDQIAWGSSSVLEQTRTRATELGLAVRLIDEWYDVDDAESLQCAVGDGHAAHVTAWWNAHARGRSV